MGVRLEWLSPAATVTVHHRGAHLPGAEEAVSEDLAVQIDNGGGGAVIEGSTAALLDFLDGIRARVLAARSGPRVRALADGTLLAVPEQVAREAGFQMPVAITAAAWADAICWDETSEQVDLGATGQDQAARLRDVLWRARAAALRARGGDRSTYQVLRVPGAGPDLVPVLTTLCLRVGPGDGPSPVATITRAGES